MPKFSARLKELRKEKKITQVEMANLLECAENHYQRIEYGQINVSALTLEFLADFFEVSIDYLVGRTDKREINR
ncbi:MAG: helix-turn-helix transcriptional regulator [Oscillibacter sp.]|nr:helix-turn-helix transcriptional regulator [Oscillibacter sp.]